MKRIILALPLIAATAFAAEPVSGKNATTARLNVDLNTLARVADVAKDLEDQRQVLLAIIDEDIEQLREPRGDGRYRWANLQREEESRETQERGVEKVSTEKVLESATVAAARAFRAQITVPAKRNLVASNNRVYVKSLLIDWTSFDGRSEKTEVPVDVWVKPGDSHGVALPEIARNAKVTAFLGVDSGNRKAVAEVALLKAKLVDDEKSPNYPAVRRLVDLRTRAAENKIDRGDFKAAVDEALLSLPGELEKRAMEQQAMAQARQVMLSTGEAKGSIASGDATPDVIAEINEALRLLAGSLSDQQSGRARLQQLVEKLSPLP